MKPQINADEHRLREDSHAIHQGAAWALNGEGCALMTLSFNLRLSAFICGYFPLPSEWFRLRVSD